MKRVVIYQPQYFPRLHYFNRVLDTDTYVIFESAQYIKVLKHVEGKKKVKHKSFQSDSPIKSDDEIQFLTVPIQKKYFQPISKTKISYDQNWTKKHLRTLEHSYKKAPFFNTIFPQINSILSKKYDNLAHLNTTTLLWGISTVLELNLDLNNLTLKNINNNLTGKNVRLSKIISDTQTKAQHSGEKSKGSRWVAGICRSLNAKEHLHGQTSKEGYMDLKLFDEIGVKSVIQNWTCAQYPQVSKYPQPFIPNLSILDLLFNVSPTKAREILYPR